MARITIQPNDRILVKYYDTIKELRETKQNLTEGNSRRAFSSLISGLGKRRKLTLIEEREMRSITTGDAIRTDGSLVDAFERPYAHWEAKDTDDNLYAEIEKKKTKGYPLTNIIFEDTRTAVLYQGGNEARRTAIREKKNFAELLTQYLNYKAEQFETFNEAAQSYGDQIREIATQLKEKIEAAHLNNPRFQTKFDEFMELCRTSLNPNISIEAVDEMLIQHLMTEPIIRRVFDKPFFSQTNVIAARIQELSPVLMSNVANPGEFYGPLDKFHRAIEDAAEDLDFSDKQTFINSVYEKFFQGYSVDIADTHGIVYTPQEIVDFMCAAVEEVLQTEFGKKLGDEGVFIIDPATGTGNFVVNLLRRAYKRNLRNFEDFYRQRLFANEVMLMPYYIASLNIEREYYELTGKAAPFEGLCFVDTLDLARERQLTFFNEENTERVERQKAADINVIIGNPPYNVGQVNENDNNKNRKYDVIDQRIRQTYAKDSNATLKNQLYDAYVRFFRWAIDRLDGRPGIVCYVSNNSFVDQYAFDGMRKHLLQDFDRVYHLDLHGNVRQNPKISGTSHNVFGIQVGVGITVAVRSERHEDHKLYYHRVPEFWRKENKLDFLSENVTDNGRHNSLNTVDWRCLVPNQKHTWLRTETESEFDSFVALRHRRRRGNRHDPVHSVFAVSGPGILTSRDLYVYDFDKGCLNARTVALARDYNTQVAIYEGNVAKPDVDDFVNYSLLDWSATLKQHLKRGTYADASFDKTRESLYRPFTAKLLHYDKVFVDRPGVFQKVFPNHKAECENRLICLTGTGSEKPFMSLLTHFVPDLHVVGAGCSAQCFPFYTYDEDGSNRRENITDYALDLFRSHYSDTRISKWDIFHYVYGLLHHPGYRQRYALDLKRNLPRIPFAPAFRPYADAGQQLAEFHLNYESVDRYELEWDSTRQPVSYRVEKMLPKGKVDSAEGNYKVYETLKYNDTLTLHGIPERAFAYRLGNRSALDWIVDQYRVKTDKRSDITHDPNGYSDDEQYILKLIERVITVSLRTVDIVEDLAKLPFRDESPTD